MDGPIVFVPCRLDRRDARSVREAVGRHLARFGDGSEVWVVQGPAAQEEFVPLGWVRGQTGGSSAGAAPVGQAATLRTATAPAGPR